MLFCFYHFLKPFLLFFWKSSIKKMFAENYFEIFRDGLWFSFQSSFLLLLLFFFFSATACIVYHIKKHLSTTFLNYFFIFSTVLFLSDSLDIITLLPNLVNSFLIIFFLSLMSKKHLISLPFSYVIYNILYLFTALTFISIFHINAILWNQIQMKFLIDTPPAVVT